jgi:hypothetical protein
MYAWVCAFRKSSTPRPLKKAKAALIFRLPDEPVDEWERLLEEIDENDNVTLAYRDDGGVQIFWVVPKED